MVYGIDGNEVQSGRTYQVRENGSQERELVEVEHVAQSGMITVRLLTGGAVFGGSRRDLSAKTVTNLVWEFVK